MKNRSAASLVGLTIAMSVLFTAWLPAAVPPEKDLPIRRKIQDELKASLNKMVSREKYARLYGLTYPIKTPANTFPQVQRAANAQFEEMARQKHPDSWVDEQMKSLVGRYEQWKIGDLVVVRMRDGKTHKERLRKITNTTITVGPNEIRKEDIETRSLLHVDSVLAAKARTHDLTRLQNKLEATRAAYVRELRITDEEDFYKKAGYIKIRGEWKSEYDFFEERIEAEREEFTKILLPALEDKHYYNAGYRQFDGEWYDPKEAEALAAAENTDPEPGGPSALDKLGSKIKAIFVKTDDATDSGSEGVEGEDSAETPASTARKGDAIWAVLLIVAVFFGLAVVAGVIAVIAKKKR